VEQGIAQLQKDKLELCEKLSTSCYREAHLDQSVSHIHSILDQALKMITQAAETESTDIWKDLQSQMQNSLTAYREYLHGCRGRQEFLECQKCLDRLTAVLKNVRESEEEDSRLTCCICMDARIDCSAKCGHLFCATCTQSVETCPICRKSILPEEIRPVFFC